MVVCLEEDSAESTFANGIVLQVELVESMESVLMGVHVQGVD